MPGPLSATSISTKPPWFLAVTEMEPPFDEYLTALERRFSTERRTSFSSSSAPISPSSKELRAIPRRFATGWIESTAAASTSARMAGARCAESAFSSSSLTCSVSSSTERRRR